MNTDTHDLFSAFLNNRDTAEPRKEAVSNVRKAAFRAALGELGAEKVRDLNPHDQDLLIEAFRIPNSIDRRPQPGPAFSMMRAEQIAQEVGGDMGDVIRFLEAQAEGHGYQEAGRRLAARDRMRPPLDCIKRMSLIAAEDRRLSEIEAERDGKLWTIRGAMTFGRADFLIVNGRAGQMLEAMIAVEFPEAIGVVELVTMGDKKDARTRAAELVNVDEMSIRFLS